MALPLDSADPVADDLQRPAGGNGGIELAQAAGGGVAGVGEDRLSGLLPLAVQSLEIMQVHVDLAADLEQRRIIPLQHQRHGWHGLQIFSDLLAGCAVPPGGAELQPAIAINQLDRHPVHLQLADIIERLFTVQKTPGAGIELAHLRGIEGILQGEHGEGVADRFEFLQRRGTDPLRGGSRGRQVREGFFQLEQFAEKPVILGIGNFRPVEYVVEIVVAVQFGAEFGVASGGLLAVHSISWHCRSRKKPSSWGDDQIVRCRPECRDRAAAAYGRF